MALYPAILFQDSDIFLHVANRTRVTKKVRVTLKFTVKVKVTVKVLTVIYFFR